MIRPGDRGAFAIVTAVACALAIGGATVAGVAEAAVMFGVALGWLVQSAAYWVLATATVSGRLFGLAWFGGIGTRFFLFALFWIGTEVTGQVEREAAVAFAFTLVGLLLVEALWIGLRLPRSVRATRRTTE